MVDGERLMPASHHTLDRMRNFADKHGSSHKITECGPKYSVRVAHDLGPQLAVQALFAHHDGHALHSLVMKRRRVRTIF